jgi:predicted transcriptional regulator
VKVTDVYVLYRSGSKDYSILLARTSNVSFGEFLCTSALERMGANGIEILPVVNRADVHKLEGIVTLRDVLDAYGVSRA